MRRIVLLLVFLAPLCHGKRLQRSQHVKRLRTLTLADLFAPFARRHAFDTLTALKLLQLESKNATAFKPSMQPALELTARHSRTVQPTVVMWEKSKFEKSASTIKSKSKTTTKSKVQTKVNPKAKLKKNIRSKARSASKSSKGMKALMKLVPSLRESLSSLPAKSKNGKHQEKKLSKSRRKEETALEMLRYDSSRAKRKGPKEEKRVHLEIPGSLLPAQEQLFSASNSSSPAPKFTKFSELPVNPHVLRVLQDVYKYDSMTPVQAASIGPALRGLDVLAKSRTGTGKTFAFLIPAIERALRFPADGASVSVLVLSPTRTLAQQIAVEARRLSKFINPALLVAVMTGGENIKTQTEVLEETPDLLVATPGRLSDLIRTKAVSCSGLRGVVLDEADRLLGLENRESVMHILSKLPHHSVRQTLMFSATFSEEIKEVARDVMRPNTVIVDVTGTPDSLETQGHVPQALVVTSLKQQLGAVMRAVHQAHHAGGKVLVFVPTARQATMYAEAYNELSGLLTRAGRQPLRCIELQSRQTQAQRTKFAEEFRRSPSAVVFASDLAARGMDFPDVTLVVQVGAPKTRELYTHRIGRTARAGKSGAGIVFLADYERPLLESDLLRGFPFSDQSNESLYLPDSVYEADVEWAIEQVKLHNSRTGRHVYHAFMAHHQFMAKQLGWSQEDVVMMSNRYAKEALMLENIPILDDKTLEKMGLHMVAGLRLDVNPSGRSNRELGKNFRGFVYTPP